MRWIRIVLPDIGWAALFAAGYAVFAVFKAFVQLKWNVNEPFDRLEVAYLVLAAASYGAYRVMRFHPILRNDYLAWLEMTPWTRDRPPPLGPLHLVLQDIVVVGLITLASWEADSLGPAMVLVGFEAGYLAALVVALFQIRQTAALYALVFLLGLMIRVMPDLLLAIGVGVVAYGSVVWRRLVGYPWPEEPHWTNSLRGSPSDGANELGWPFGRLGPTFVREGHIAFRDAMICAILFGWLTHVYFYQLLKLGQMQLHMALLFPYMTLIVAGVTRLATYLPGYLPPISFLGRLMTGRLIIPGYDRVFAAPVCALLVALLLSWFRPAGLSDGIFHPTVCTTCLLVILGMGPELKAWRLTGSHRVTMMRGTLEQAG